MIPTSVAPAEAGVQANARIARRVFAWIPAYAGTTMLLSLAKLKARGCSRFFAPIVVPAIFPRIVVGLRRDDPVFESRPIQSARFRDSSRQSLYP